MSDAILRTENLSKRFKAGRHNVRALREVNMEVQRGEFISIRGPSGSGKTTLLTMLGCIDTPTEGKMILDGEDVTSLPESGLCDIRRRKIGFIFQMFNILPYLSALENVELPMETVEHSPEKRREKAMGLLKMVGLRKRMSHRPNKLSAGEQQRVAIARALANDPSIILADEPTGNLDTRTKQGIMGLLSRLNAERGTTIIMVTHDPAVCNSTDRMLWLSDGRILKKERKGFNLIRKKLMCPRCHCDIRPEFDECPECKAKLEPAGGPDSQSRKIEGSAGKSDPRR